MRQTSVFCSLHPWLLRWFPPGFLLFPLQVHDCSFIQCQAHLWVLLTKLGLSLCAGNYECPHYHFCSPRHIFATGNVYICVGMGHPLALVSCLLPQCKASKNSWACFVCPPVHLWAEGQALVLTIGTRKDSLGSYPSHRTHLRLGQSQDSVLCAVPGCISALHLSPFYMKNMKVPGDFFFLQARRWQQMWKQIYSSSCKLVLCFHFSLTINRYSWKYLAVKN